MPTLFFDMLAAKYIIELICRYIIVFTQAIFLDRRIEIYCYIRKRLYYSK